MMPLRIQNKLGMTVSGRMLKMPGIPLLAKTKAG